MCVLYGSALPLCASSYPMSLTSVINCKQGLHGRHKNICQAIELWVQISIVVLYEEFSLGC